MEVVAIRAVRREKIFAHLDKEIITNAALEIIGSLPALPMSSHDASQELIAQLNDAVETLRNNPAVIPPCG